MTGPGKPGNAQFAASSDFALAGPQVFLREERIALPVLKSQAIATTLRFCAMATWCGALTGLAEGIIFLVARNYPLINAAHKVPIEGLWIAPLFETLAWFVLGCIAALPLLWGPVARRWQAYVLAASFVMVFAGVSLILSDPGLLHPISILVLAGGIAAGVCRKVAGREEKLLGWAGRRIAGVPVILLGCYLLVALGTAAKERYTVAQLPAADAGAPNVIVMVLDTLRWDRLPPNLHPAFHTPELDRIAREGVVFSNAWTTGPWSLPSQTSILTGRDPSDHGGDWHRGKMRDGIPTLGGYLQGHGYVTAAFSGNASWVTPEYLGRGFQHFEPIRVLKAVLRLSLGRRLAKYVPPGSAPFSKVADALNANFWSWADRRGDRPFFAYMCYMDVNNSGHEDLLHLPEQAAEHYDHALEALDRRIGELDRELERRGLRENTILIITSDHGESFGPRGADHEETLHMTSVYPEQMRVPLLIRWPRKISGGTVSAQTVSLQQIPATIEMLMKGQASVFASPITVAGPAPADAGCAFGELRELHGQRTQAMVACGPLQFIQRNAVEELYDLAADPKAQKNQIAAAELAEQRDHMRALLNGWLKQQDQAATRQ